MNINSEQVKKLRNQKSLSQEKLAEMAGLSLRTIQRIETEGIAAPQTRIALAEALDTTPKELLSDLIKGGGREQKLPLSLFQRLTGPIESIWTNLVRYPLQFAALTFLCTCMAFIAWMAFVILVEGIFYITHTEIEVGYWQNLGNSIIGASFFILPFLLFQWIFRKIRRLMHLNLPAKC